MVSQSQHALLLDLITLRLSATWPLAFPVAVERGTGRMLQRKCERASVPTVMPFRTRLLGRPSAHLSASDEHVS